MESAWVGAVSALGGVALGIAAEAWRARAAFRRDKNWELHESERAPLETVYEALEEVREGYARSLQDTAAILRSGRTSVDNFDVTPIPWARLRMLVNLYLPELDEHLVAVEKAGPDFALTLARAVAAMSANTTQNKQLAPQLYVEFKQFIAVVNAMRDHIVTLSGRVASGKALLAGRRK